MAEVERELAIVYGGYVVGGKSNNILESYHYVEKGYVTSRIEFSFVITGYKDPSSFAAACRAAEKAFRKINQTVTVLLQGRQLLQLGQRIGAGYDTHARIYKPNDAAQTARSRLYRVEIYCSMQASTGEERSSGLRNTDVSVTYGPSRRRTVVIMGQYTSFGSTKAREQYENQADTFCNAVLSALTGTYDLVEERAVSDTYDNECDFRREYLEIIFNQGPSGLDDQEIIDQRLVLSPQWVAPGDYPEAKVERIININLGYAAWIDKDKNTNLKAKYDSLRNWLIGQARTVVDASSVALVSETFTENPDDNSFTVSMQLQAVGKSKYLMFILGQNDTLDSGMRQIPIWTGEPFDRYEFQGPATAMRIFNVEGVRKDVIPNATLSKEIEGYVQNSLNAPFHARYLGNLTPQADDWRLVGSNVVCFPKERGRTPNIIKVTEFTGTVTYQYRKIVKEGGVVTPTTPTTGGGSSRVPIDA